MSTEVVMPQMGESIAEGTITKWLKQVGDRVERDEPLFEISTDKVDAEIPSPAAGTLTEIRFKEGDTVEINTTVAVLDGGAAGAAPAATSTETVVKEAQPEQKQSEVTAAKAQSAEIESPPVQTVPAAKAEAAQPKSEPAPAAAETVAQQKPAAPRKETAPQTAQPTGNGGGATATAEELRRTKSSPLVRKIAQEHGVDIAGLEGTGMSGRVTKNDILSFIESGAPAAASARTTQASPAVQTPAAAPSLKPGEGDRVEQMTVMRKKIAEHMVVSRRTSAHVTTVYEIDMTRIAKLREQHKDSFAERTGTKLSFMPFIFQAVNNGLRKFPIFNAQVSGDQIIYKRDINLGMAVALDWGLIVPVIKRADDLSISGLARAANDLAERARAKQLKPDEVGGGTFTITNPGVFGGLFGTPIINQPQLAILGVGKIEKRAKVLTTPDGEDYIAIRWMAYFALSFDHRVIDGADAERFLAYVKEQLEAGEFSL
ncbi:MAG TPA: 2-oxoglutarate dehydrogenase, E2 component, dihydrolipoamide succinyltransferase [Blastocatellia bacterium]|nr:2-oxoglutarate dehydrogenase, E2 component, dihydrolipoamide succinyltransferase [Blastocatellia bacterium]